MKRVVVLFIDAFSHSYINSQDTPFLFTQNVHSLTPVFGFKQLAAAFGTSNPLSAGFFVEYYFDPDGSPYRWSGIFPPALLSVMDIFRPAINVTARHILTQKVSLSRMIPLKMTRFFNKDSRAYPNKAPLIELLSQNKFSHRLIFAPQVKSNIEACLLYTSDAADE